MADIEALHHALLRPAIIQILRAAGFHSTKPSVLDTLTDLAARYMLLISQKTAEFAYDRTAIPHNFSPPSAHGIDSDAKPPLQTDGIQSDTEIADSNITGTERAKESSTRSATESATQQATQSATELATQSATQPAFSLPSTTTTTTIPHGTIPDLIPPTPNLHDVLQSLTVSSLFASALTPSEEAWRETLRRPLSSYPPGAAREKERRRRDAEDTRDVREFVEWCTGSACAEMRRVAGVGGGREGEAVALTGAAMEGEEEKEGVKERERDDYLAALKKKHSRVGDGARYVGTVLGRHGREEGLHVGEELRIEGGPETLRKWRDEVAKRRKMEGENGNLEATRIPEGVEAV